MNFTTQMMECISSIHKISVDANSVKDTCSLAGPDAWSLLEWATVFLRPTELARRVSINMNKYQDIFEKDMTDVRKYFEQNDMFNGGDRVGDAFVWLIGNRTSTDYIIQ